MTADDVAAKHISELLQLLPPPRPQEQRTAFLSEFLGDRKADAGARSANHGAAAPKA